VNPGRAFIGTAGWSIARIHAARFPKLGSHLERYAAVFSATEINTSFYRPHRKSTYERWSASVPDHFRFSVKAPKSVSHSDWRDMDPDLDAFLAEIAGLRDKLGPVLIQLPPKRDFTLVEAEGFLSAFRCRTLGDIVLEPRHASWFEPAADDLLRAYRIARVAADPPPAGGSDRPGGWPGLTYQRLHGSPVIYRSSYPEDRLNAAAAEMRTATDVGSDAWCIFDNTTSYAAAGNALSLLGIVRQ
jgi:uncharacterized protein YecE (DUF72 family)